MTGVRVRRHAGRYSTRARAEDYAAALKAGGDEVEVVPATVYDVFTIEREKP